MCKFKPGFSFLLILQTKNPSTFLHNFISKVNNNKNYVIWIMRNLRGSYFTSGCEDFISAKP